ncbi:MAG: hypothetical protein RIC16_00165 [Rhodospirillales bacterium]
MILSEAYQTAIIGAICGSVVVLALGFTLGGWVTGGIANDRADMAARLSERDVMVRLCVARSVGDPGSSEIIANMKKSNSYTHAQIVANAGWATMPWETRPDRRIADECAGRLSKEF